MTTYAKRSYFVYNYIYKYYYAETLRRTYVGVVHAIGSPANWLVPVDVKSQVIKVLIARKLPGRLKKKMIESNGEEPSRPKCSHCGQAGHNKKTCRNVLPVSSTLSQSGNSSTRRSRRRIEA